MWLVEAALLSFVTNEVAICHYISLFSIFGMWIPVFTKTTVQNILGKQGWKQVSLCEKKPKFRKLKLVYKVQRCLGNSELSRKQEYNYILLFIFVANSTRSIGQVLLEIHLSEIREYWSRTGGQLEVFCPECPSYSAMHLPMTAITWTKKPSISSCKQPSRTPTAGTCYSWWVTWMPRLALRR